MRLKEAQSEGGETKRAKSERLTRSQIAQRSGIDRGTVFKYLAMAGAPEADAKGKRDYAESVAFIGKMAPRAGAGSDEQKKLRTSLLRVQLELAEIELATQRGENLPKSMFAPAIASAMTQLSTDMSDIFEKEFPAKMHGRTTVEIAELMASGVDRVLKRLKAGAAPLMT